MAGLDNNRSPRRFSPLRGLSGKVLGMVIIFVLLGEVLIFLPSIANFRIQWFKSRIAQAEIAALAAEAAPNQMPDAGLRSEILKGAGVIAVSLKRGETRYLVLHNNEDAMIDARFDLRPGRFYSTMGEALAVMLRSSDRVIAVKDYPPNMSGDEIEVALHEEPLRQAMLSYAFNIMVLSIILSLIVAAMVFAALNRILVQPIKRLTSHMLGFAARPEDHSRIIVPSGRSDEIGMAEAELKAMQIEISSMLQQKNHLAALGLAVSKVSHDLRNMLSSAHIISDRMAMLNDPTVRRFAPKLIASLDRAISFLGQMLTFGRLQESPPRREVMPLHEAVAEAWAWAELHRPQNVRLKNTVPRAITINADREHMYRILTNLVRNAMQALEQAETDKGLVTISGERRGRECLIRITDNGPGIPPAVRDRLFQAFQSAAKAGGTGLGLAIAAELAEAHGGRVEVAETGPGGTAMVVTIPDPPGP
jgi:signal transduction histidine kinase